MTPSNNQNPFRSNSATVTPSHPGDRSNSTQVTYRNPPQGRGHSSEAAQVTYSNQRTDQIAARIIQRGTLPPQPQPQAIHHLHGPGTGMRSRIPVQNRQQNIVSDSQHSIDGGEDHIFELKD